MKVYWAVVICVLIAGSAYADELTYKERLIEQLAEKVPAILKTFDSESGRFGTGCPRPAGSASVLTGS